MSRRILIINGPNLNLLGTREPETYGTETLEEIMTAAVAHAADQSANASWMQANDEAAIIKAIHDAPTTADGLIVNAAGLTHTSVVVRDAILGVDLPMVEIHLSNVHAREPFRRQSYLSDIAIGQISGFGGLGYRMAIDGLLNHLTHTGSAKRQKQ